MPIRIADYDPNWPARFEVEARVVRAAFAPGLVRLHHIGSTSVRGLAAKPVIDMLAEVSDLDQITRPPQYEAMGAFGIDGRRYFRKDSPDGERLAQIHAFASGSPHLARHLAFRDYLRAHCDVARAYGALKRGLAARGPDAGAYMDGKDSFVKRVEAEALSWAQSAP